MAFQEFELNMIPHGDMPTFYASQYETGRPIIIDVMLGEDAFACDELYVELHCRKVDDNIVTLEPDSVDGNQVTFIGTDQLFACPGKNLCEVCLYADETKDTSLGSLNFFIEVEPDPLAGGLTSETQIYDLYQQVEEITQQVIGDDYYDKTEVDDLLDDKADKSDTYTKSQVDDALNLKADKSTTYTKTQVDNLLNDKADKATTYTKMQVDSALALKANSADLATVATTGDYDDLTNKPTIPAAQVQSDWDQSDNTKVDYIKNKPDLSVYATSDDLNAAIYDLLPVGNASGSIAGFSTALAVNLVDCTAQIDYNASGYTGVNLTRCGVNLFEVDSRVSQTMAYVTYTSDDNYIYMNGTKNGGGYAVMSGLTATLPTGTYYIKAFAISGTASNTVSLYGFDGSDNITSDLLGGERTLTLSEPTTFGFRFAVWADGTVLDNYKVGIVITTASGISTYHAYNGTTYAVSWQTEAGTVYGGYIDLTTGLLVSNKNADGTDKTPAESYGLEPVPIMPLIGVNNIFADTGDTSVQYKDTIQHYIDSRV